MSPHHEPLRIQLDDVDAAGVAFGPRLVVLAHRAAETILARLGLDLAAVLREGTVALPLVRIESDFRAPLRHGDQVVAELSCRRIGTSSLTLAIRLVLAGEVACEVVQVHVCIDPRTRTPVSIPAPVRDVLGALVTVAG